MTLETPRLTLLEWRPEDFDLLYPIVSDPETMSFWPAPFSAEKTREWIARSITHYNTGDLGRRRVVLKETGETIGDVGIMRSEVNGQPENDIGYIVHCAWWGRGFALEAARACAEYAFESLGLGRLVANMAEDHLRSAHVAEQLGMKLERTFINTRNRDLPTRLYVLER